MDGNDWLVLGTQMFNDILIVVKNMITEATYLTGPREHLFDKVDQGANVIIALFFLPCPSLEYRQSKSSVGVRVPCGAHHNELELRWTWSFEGSKIPPHPRSFLQESLQ